MTNHALIPPPLQLSQRAGWATGQPISELMAQAIANPDLISLAAGFVDQATLPAKATQEAFEELFSNFDSARAALQYGTTIGYEPLREVILDRIRIQDAAVTDYRDVSVDQILITAGSNQLLQLIGETILDPGDIVLCAAPTYFVFLGLLANQGAQARGIDTDTGGILPEALDAELERLDTTGELSRVKAIYCVTYFDNPSGITLAKERRPAIIDITKKWSHYGRIIMIEDTAYRLLRYADDDLPSLRAYDTEGDTVVTTGTFSKTYSPGMRVGWSLLPRDLIGPVCEQKGNYDFGSPNFTQHLMYHLLVSGRFDDHVEQLRVHYRSKRDAMLNAAEQYFAGLNDVSWIIPKGGLYVWMKLPEGVDTGPESRLFSLATDSGVLYVPGQYCYPQAETRFKNRIRLSFGVQNEKNIRQGMKSLAEAVRHVVS